MGLKSHIGTGFRVHRDVLAREELRHQLESRLAPARVADQDVLVPPAALVRLFTFKSHPAVGLKKEAPDK